MSRDVTIPDATVDLKSRAELLQSYATEGYRTVDGWGIDDVLVPLFLALNEAQRAAGVRGDQLEIGVHHGRTFILMALMAAPDERSHGIDLFEDQARNLDHSGQGDSSAFAANMRRHASGVDYETYAGDSLFLDFAAVGIGGVRFAHIDGAHYVDAVISDLHKVQQVMVPGGVVIVDDFLHSGFPGVAEGCHRYLLMAQPRLLVPLAVGRNKLFLTTHSHHGAWLQVLAEALAPEAGREVILHGTPVVCIDPH